MDIYGHVVRLDYEHVKMPFEWKLWEVQRPRSVITYDLRVGVYVCMCVCVGGGCRQG